MVLGYGQDPNAPLPLFSKTSSLETCRPLHMAPPPIAAELLRHGADPKVTDSKGRTALTWMLNHPAELCLDDRLECAHRYELCKMLIEAGDTVGIMQVLPSALEDSLEEFEGERYDTGFLRELYGSIETVIEIYPVESLSYQPVVVVEQDVVAKRGAVSDEETANDRQREVKKRSWRWHDKFRLKGMGRE